MPIEYLPTNRSNNSGVTVSWSCAAWPLQHVAARYPGSDTRSAWWNQGAPMIFRQWDKTTVWGYDNGLASCITQGLTLNMLGYPYHFPDMIGGNAYFSFSSSKPIRPCTPPRQPAAIGWLQPSARSSQIKEKNPFASFRKRSVKM